ncbi:uncharacterized protein KGF55_002441 [Candida pseudojiufengensis]|uniref:uncharacterized protein n=1 Tax=Candida pseudojiufengensis TaxID=497109 RepID=UPI002224D297|nr:uncharacterized protein KGF55_002441 [Candida pseudojiufengensis]KAI5963561.1 hypothetical protein KGF55_002441 [Candida pseudojiufengensis]
MSGALSSRVKNMKFMQKPDDSKINDTKVQETKLHDLSEWVLPNSQRILKLASMKSRIEKVGYGAIMSDRNYRTTRRSWGNKYDMEEVMDDNSIKHEELRNVSRDKDQDMSSLWRKRKAEHSPDSKKKKRIL